MRLLAGVVLAVTLLLGSSGAASAEMLETGFDRPGGDYSSSIGIPSPGQCQDQCQDDDACRAWTWVKPGIQGSKSVCYLKSVIPPQKTSSCCTSGVKLAGPIPPNATAGADRFGSDYASLNLTAPKPKACADACAGDPACKAWTYVNPGIKGPQAVCFLKNAVPAASSDSCCISAVKASLPPPVTLPPGAVIDKDRPGLDFASSVLPGPNPKLCYDQCEANAACKAWTYVKPGVQGPKAICYLKKAVPNAVNDTCCISGVKAEPPPAVLPPGAASNKDRPGSDFASSVLPGPNPKLCYDQCEANAACKAWTYVKPGVQGPKAICYLKKAVPNAVNDTCCISGVKAEPPPVVLPPGAVANKDRPGADFASSVLPGPNPKLCYDQCEANAACKAWTYVKPGVQGPKAICYLKKAVPDAVNDTCCISGVKAAPPAGKIEKNTNRPGADYVEFPLGGQKTEALCMAACALQGKCKAWTFVKPGYQGSKARCWLKSKVPPAEYDECCTSGVK